AGPSLSRFKALRDSRILALGCEEVSLEGSGETIPSVSHGLGSGGLVVAIPAAEACGDPGDEGEGFRGMRVLLALGLSLEPAGEELKGDLEALVDDVRGGSRSAISGVDELAVLEGEPIALEGPEGLLDAPAQPVELDDLLGLSGIGHRMGGHEAPEERGFTGGSVDLAGFDQAELEGLGEVFHETIVGPGNADPCRPQLDRCGAALVARP